MSTLKTGALRGTSGTADSIQLHASDQSVTFPGNVTCSGTATGFGKLLNYVVGTPDANQRSTTSATWATASSTCNVSITPSSASSKIAVVCFAEIGCNDGDDSWNATIFRDIGGTNTNIGDADAGIASGRSVAGITGLFYPTTMFMIDSPSTTSACTYQLYVKLRDLDSDSAGNVYINNPAAGNGWHDSWMHVFELAG